MECIRKMGYAGKCKEEATVGNFCNEHSKEMCRTCKTNIATCECVMASSLVCGMPLCDNCRCSIHNQKGA